MSMESFSVKDERSLDGVQHQHRSFDQVSFVMQWRKIADSEIVYVLSLLWYR